MTDIYFIVVLNKMISDFHQQNKAQHTSCSQQGLNHIIMEGKYGTHNLAKYTTMIPRPLLLFYLLYGNEPTESLTA
jgi:hypothetical protein